MTEVYISDVHVPFEDKAAVKLARRMIRRISPDIVFLGGDIIDFYAISSYSKDPVLEVELQEEIDRTKSFLKDLREDCPNAKFYWLDGNHEDRLQRYLWAKTRALSTLRGLNVSGLLGLKKFEIEYHPHKESVEIGKLWHIHGDEISGASTNVAKAIYQKLQTSVILGHFHIFQYYYGRRMGNDTTHGVFCNGTLGALDPEYTFFPNWQQGFTVINYSPSGYFSVEPVVFFRQGSRIYTTYRGVELTGALS